MEFAVKMSCDSCASHIKDALNINGVNDVNVSLNDGTVLVQTTLPAAIIQEKIESTGMRAVLKGYGADNPRGNNCLVSYTFALGFRKVNLL